MSEGFTAVRRKSLSLCRDQNGAAAVEFALVVPIFLALVFSILEAGWFFFVNSAVEQANSTASRLIRTGQAQTATDAGGNPVYTEQAFFDKICDVVDTFGNCNERLTVNIQKFNSFAGLSSGLAGAVCRDTTDATIEGSQFTATDYGAQNEIIAVQVCFLYKPLNPALGLQMSTNSDGFKELTAVSIFRNEPYED